MKRVQSVLLVILFVALIGPMTSMAFVFNSSLDTNQIGTRNYNKTRITLETLTDFVGEVNNVKLPLSIIHEQPIQEKTPMNPRSWTVLVYLDGDNDLEEAAFDDFNAMESVGGTAEVNIIVFVDFWDGGYAPFTGAKCYNLTKDTDLDTINQVELTTGLPSEPNMGSSTTLINFIVFGQTYAPADNYLLVLWDHGAGFYGICYDYTNGNDPLYPSELATALGSGAIQSIDVVAMDACMMGQLEVAYEIGSYVDYIVFSEDNVPWYGYPYEEFLQDLTNTPGTTSANLASNIVTNYIQAYSPGGIYYPPSDEYITLSAIQASKIGDVAVALDSFTDALLPTTTLSTYYEALCNARGLAQTFGWPDFMDLADFAAKASLLIQDPTISNLAQDVSTKAQAAIHFEQHLSGDADATGLGIAFSTHYSIPLDLTTDTNYEDFMNAFLDKAGTSSDSILITDGGTHYGYLDGYYDSVFYRFVPEVSGTYTLRLESIKEYDEDFDLFLYDNEGYEVDASQSVYSSETIQYNFVAGETYYIEAYSYPGASVIFGLGAFSLVVSLNILTNVFIIAIIAVAIVIVIIIVFFVWRLYSQKRQRPHSWQTETAYSPYGKPVETQPTRTPPIADTRGFCVYCGASMPEGAAFCPNCGASRSG